MTTTRTPRSAVRRKTTKQKEPSPEPSNEDTESTSISTPVPKTPSVKEAAPTDELKTGGSHCVLILFAVLVILVGVAVFYIEQLKVLFEDLIGITRLKQEIKQLQSAMPQSVAAKSNKAFTFTVKPAIPQHLSLGISRPTPELKTSWRPKQEDVTPAKTIGMLPSSSVWCKGENKSSRICRFRNLCFHPYHNEWFILKTNTSIIENVPLNQTRYSLLELSTIENHNIFYWKYVEADPFDSSLRNLNVRYETDWHFMFSRLHPNNIMHTFHDDVIGLFYVIQEYIGNGSFELEMPFSLNNHRLLLLDPYGPTPATRPLQYFSQHPMRFSTYLTFDDTITCFRDAVVGNSKIGTWYQYGFDKPQGPIDKQVNGNHIRKVVEWYLRRLRMPLNEQELQDSNMVATTSTTQDIIVVLVRKRNRLILNQDELVKGLEKYALPVQLVSNEEHSMEQQIQFLRRAKVVIGMHGSILIMAMFCQRGAVLIEMFPFGIPAENYTPYKRMAELTSLTYRAWVNPLESNSKPAPHDAHKLQGGLAHLSVEEQLQIINNKTVPIHICCENPHWIYRIYQDTIVDVPEVLRLVDESLATLVEPINLRSAPEPPLITGLECLNDPEKPSDTLWIRWKPFWTMSPIEKYNVVVQGKVQRVYDSLSNSIQIDGFEPGERVKIFVRPVFKGEYREYAKSIFCNV